MKRQLNISRLVTIVSALALAVIIAVGSTFSWYNRTTKTTDSTGNKLQYSISGAKVNSTKIELLGTYLGTENNGKFTYGEKAIDGSVTVAKDQQVVYFKTVIENTNNGDALVSLYLEGLNYTNLGNSMRIGIINPEKTYKQTITTTVESEQTVDYVCVADNILVPNNSTDLESDNTFSVYWFIKFDATALNGGTLDLGKMHLVYN